MSTSKYVDKICIAAISAMLVITVFFMFGEKLGITVIHRQEDESINEMFTENDLNADWDTSSAAEIVLNGDSAKITGNGAYFSNNTLYIAYAGKYVISGTLDGSIHIDADGDDKIWLLFDGVNITSKTDAPLYIKQADKVFLTLKENSQNILTFENDEEGSEIDGSIFSRDDFTVNGKGNLTVTSSGLHGVVCNDTLVFTGGNISITAKKDAVRAHDAIKICNTTLTVSAGDDGLHAGNDDESAIFYLESGNINVTECYEGIEANDITIAGGTVNIAPSDDGINANGSSKTSRITVSGGDITVINKNGRDADGFDSNGSIHITGGNVFISVSGNGTNNAIDYGSENGGKCTVSGGTVIACGSSQMAEGPDSDSTQGFIMQTFLGNENETLSVFNKDGKEIIRKEIPCSFTSALISSPEISFGDTVTLKIGEAETKITVSNTVEGGMGSFGNKDGFDPGRENGQGGQNPFEDSNGNNSPELPDNSDENGEFPQRPDSKDAPPERRENTQNGTPPEIPEGDDRGGMQIPDGKMPDRMQWPGMDEQGEKENNTSEPPANDNQNQNGDFNGDSNNEKGQDPMPNSKIDNTDDKMQMPGEQSHVQNSTSSSTWIWLGISALVLIGGFFIVLKKRY